MTTIGQVGRIDHRLAGMRVDLGVGKEAQQATRADLRGHQPFRQQGDAAARQDCIKQNVRVIGDQVAAYFDALLRLALAECPYLTRRPMCSPISEAQALMGGKRLGFGRHAAALEIRVTRDHKARVVGELLDHQILIT
jgi:hypothetical protein